MANEMVPLFSVLGTPANAAADIKNLLEALDHISTAKKKLEGDLWSEKLKSILGSAREAAKNVNPETLVNRRKQLDEMEAKFNAQADALNFFGQKFQEVVEDYCHNFPIQVEQALRETLQKLEDNQKRRDNEEAAINERIAKIKQLLELCSSAARGKGGGVKTELKDAPDYEK
jgi:hypothetical protein